MPSLRILSRKNAGAWGKTVSSWPAIILMLKVKILSNLFTMGGREMLIWILDIGRTHLTVTTWEFEREKSGTKVGVT